MLYHLTASSSPSKQRMYLFQLFLGIQLLRYASEHDTPAFLDAKEGYAHPVKLCDESDTFKPLCHHFWFDNAVGAPICWAIITVCDTSATIFLQQLQSMWTWIMCVAYFLNIKSTRLKTIVIDQAPIYLFAVPRVLNGMTTKEYSVIKNCTP